MTTKPHPLEDLSVLDKYKGTPFPPKYPKDRRTFYSPVDQVHEALVALLNMAQKSLVVAMYGFDDVDLANALKAKLQNPGVFVQLTLDSSQAGGVHERALLAEEDFPSSLIAVGRSERGAIMHMKVCIIDGVVLVKGSTNWSNAGEEKQDNELSVVVDPWECAEARARIDTIHAHMVAAAKKGAA